MVYKIMVVDNEADVVDLITTILKKEGYKVITAYSGEECLKKLKHSNVDLILLDIMMPGMSGWSVQERAKVKYPGVKVVFLSVLEFASPEKRVMLTNAGLKDFIGKPFNPDELLMKIKIILSED